MCSYSSQSGSFIKNFYPTPKYLANRMLGKIKERYFNRVLEPSAGKGDLIDALKDRFRFNFDVSAIEINPDLQSTLRGKGISVIDSDFLSFGGPDKFDLIIANPPFDQGIDHLNKALDIMFCGQVIFLLNAESIKNPCNNLRKALIKRLDTLEAEIEFIEGAFVDAERPTGVEIALISVMIENNVEDNLFENLDEADLSRETVDDSFDVVSGDKIQAWVDDFNLTMEKGQQVIMTYFRHYNRIGGLICLNKEPDSLSSSRSFSSGSDLTHLMQKELNRFSIALRKSFWKRTLTLKEVSDRLTSHKKNEFHHFLENFSSMDFTVSNIHQFVLNVINLFPKMVKEAIVDLFDLFSKKHAWHEDLHIKNVHYFDGWKSNNAFRINKKVIVPFYGDSYHMNGPFYDWNNKLDLGYKLSTFLDDLELVVRYLDFERNFTTSLRAMVEASFKNGENRKIESDFLKMTFYKKGTIHIEFTDDNILRRFNLEACKQKAWLPHDYGSKRKEDLSPQEVAVASAFEVSEYKQESFSLDMPSSIKQIAFEPVEEVQIIFEEPPSVYQAEPSGQLSFGLFS